MTTQQTEFDGDLWFFASKNSVQELEKQHKPQANAAYSDPEKNIYVSMSGQVEIVHDKQKIKQLWNPVVAAYFDKGADDPEVILICLHVDQVEYWDAPSSKTVRLFNLKSVVTGHHDDQGRHERVMISDQRWKLLIVSKGLVYWFKNLSQREIRCTSVCTQGSSYTDLKEADLKEKLR